MGDGVMQPPIPVQRAAKRLLANDDFRTVFGFLLEEQGAVVLNMDATSERLHYAKIYYDALRDVPGLVEEAAKDLTNG